MAKSGNKITIIVIKSRVKVTILKKYKKGKNRHNKVGVRKKDVKNGKKNNNWFYGRDC